MLASYLFLEILFNYVLQYSASNIFPNFLTPLILLLLLTTFGESPFVHGLVKISMDHNFIAKIHVSYQKSMSGTNTEVIQG